MRRVITAGFVTLVVLGVVGTPVASAQQQLSFSVGGFSPRGEDARTNNDVLVNDLDFLAFRIGDFSGPLVGADYLVALGDNFDAGLGIGFYQRSVPTVYNDFVNSNGTELVAAYARRRLSAGLASAVRPYRGGAVAADGTSQRG